MDSLRPDVLEEDTPRIKDYRKVARKYAAAQGVTYKTRLGRQLDSLYTAMTEAEQKRLNNTYVDYS